MAVARGDQLHSSVNVAVLVPRRDDGGHRDELWGFVRSHLEREHPDWPIHEGHHDDGPFNRSAAINAAAELAGDWDVAVIADSDTVIPPVSLRAGVEMAAALGWMVNCLDLRIMLNERGTRRIMRGGPAYDTADWRRPDWMERVEPEAPSSAVVVRRDLFDRVGRFDEKFVGWGHEDSAFRIACETVTGVPMLRVGAPVYHLWHPESPEVRGTPTRRANMRRLAVYEAAAGDVAKIDRLTGGSL